MFAHLRIAGPGFHSVHTPRTTAQLLEHPALWRGRQLVPTGPTLASGHAALDAELPGGGLPIGAITELLLPGFGAIELSFSLPMLRAQSQAGMKVALVNPPFPPNAVALAASGVQLAHLLVVQTPALNDSAWATEQLLRSGACGLVLWWSMEAQAANSGFGAPSGASGALSERGLKRMQLAAETGNSMALVCRPARALAEISPAAVRLGVTLNGQAGAELKILKCRGRNPSSVGFTMARGSLALP